MECSIWVGFDRREQAAFGVACHSVRRRLTSPIPVRGLVLADLVKRGISTRRTEKRQVNGTWVTWDLISDAPQSTDHANARFLVPFLGQAGWALFMDGDMLALDDLGLIFEELDPSKALYCVHHDHAPVDTVKMDGQVQTRYVRKNQSSVMIFNTQHEANRALTVDLINTVPGRDLHRFCWLDDGLIGQLDPAWNYLVGQTANIARPKLVHFTSGTPDMPGYETCEYADAWRAELALWGG